MAQASTNWSKLKTAYGTAEDVPRKLAALKSATGQQFEEVLGDLCNEVCHQGTVYQAMVHVVPHFIELLRNDPPARYAGVAAQLAYLAGKAFEYGVRPPNLTPRAGVNPFTGEGIEFRIEDDRKWVRRSREAIEGGLEVYLALLRHGDPTMRCTAANILAAFPEHADQFVPVLITMTRVEKDDGGRAAIMLTLAQFEHRSTEVGDLLRDRLANGESRRERLAAAVALTCLYRPGAPAEASTLVRELSREAKWYAALHPLPIQVETESLVQRAFAAVGARPDP